MATSWVLGKVSNALQPTIQSATSAAGSFAGGALNTVGSGINGVGETINGSIKKYGDGAKDYGNGVMDWTNASATRAQTGSNPLGLSSGKEGGKRSVTSPSVYSAGPKPKPSAVSSAPLQKKVGAAPAKKALPAPVSKPTTVPKKAPATTAKPAPTLGKGVTGRPATAKTTPVTRSAASKPSTVSAPKPKAPTSYKPNPTGGANPLGLR